MPRPRSPVSSRYHSVARAASSGARARRGVVDLVVDVRDVVDELSPRSRVARSHERSHMPTTNGRALPMCARVDGRAAEVHADRPGRRRQLDERARVGVVEAHGAQGSARRNASSRGSARSTAQSSGPRSRRSARAAAPSGCRRPPSARARPSSPRPCRASPGTGPAARRTARASRGFGQSHRRSAVPGRMRRARAPRRGRARRA